jgi:hypothetical protein
MKYARSIIAATAFVAAFSFRALAASAPAPAPTPPGPFASLDFRVIGPDYGRIDAVAGVPGDPKTYFAGGLGGLLRSKDG